MSDIKKGPGLFREPGAQPEEDLNDFKRFEEEADRVRETGPAPSGATSQKSAPQRVKTFDLGNSEHPCNYIFTIGQGQRQDNAAKLYIPLPSDRARTHPLTGYRVDAQESEVQAACARVERSLEGWPLSPCYRCQRAAGNAVDRRTASQ